MDTINTTFGNDFHYSSSFSEDRPWGSFDILYEDTFCKIKKIYIKPGERPSYQYHFKRKETWMILKGTGLLTLDDVDSTVGVGDVINVNFEQKHTIKNIGNDMLIFVEIQTGTYFGEDDIVRINDNYGRS